MLQLFEIIRRSDQGVTRPFICRGEDGDLYYVKGVGAGSKALIAEWIAGNLASLLGLPVAPFTLAEVAPNLLHYSASDEIRDLGSKPVFASRAVALAEELRFEHIPRVGTELKKRVFLFDCWITNGDRSLSEQGGNPNLLWTPHESKMHLIDHNLAFEDESIGQLKSDHIFGSVISDLTEEFRKEATIRMRSALEQLPHLWKLLPDEWLEYPGLSLSHVEEILWRFDHSPAIFWA